MVPHPHWVSLRGRRGASVIEYALVLPLLVLLVVGISDLSAGWRVKHLLTEAAHEGARMASVVPNLQPDDPRVRAVIDDMVQHGGLAANAYSVTVRFRAAGGQPAQPGDPVTVAIINQGLTASGSPLSPLWPNFHIRAASTMRYERHTTGEAPPLALPPFAPVGQWAGGAERC